MKNHYISQFIIKRFSKAINVFDIENGTVDESKRPCKVFFEKNIFDEEIEKILNFNIESRVANILDKKICDKEEIILNREEVLTLKRYMLISSIRSMGMDYAKFGVTMRRFLKNAESYIAAYPEYKNMPDLTQIRLTDEELFQRTLKVFASTTIIRDIVENPLATKEMLGWAIPFLESYMAFWDAPESREFILTDNGMASEYEGFHMLTGGVDISKSSYLLYHAKRWQGHIGLLATNSVMYENYNFFVVNSTRMLVMVHPFFRLYHNQKVLIGDRMEQLPIPDIWPAIIQDRALFDVPENRYAIAPNLFANGDLFIYKPKKLCHEDYIYINELNLSYAKKIIGFNNSRSIVDTVYYHIWKSANYQSVRSREDKIEDIWSRLIEGVANSPYRFLLTYCEHKKGQNKTNFIELFERLTDNIYKDFNENPYICEYYLARPEETAAFKQLDFLGEGHKKVEFFKEHLEKIKLKNKNDIPS